MISLEGNVLLLDKPIGLSSNNALQKVKRIYGVKKAGHAGNLDPLATGMLPICFGEATKFLQFLLNADKSYRVEFKLGEKTNTGDAEGEIIERHAVNVEYQQLSSVVNTFLGQIKQIPPMYSALKYQGQALYKLARQGIEVPREPRCVQIYSIQLLGFEHNHALMEVSCSKGTYIRTLVEDIGDVLKCGAYVTALRRREVGNYKESQMVAFEKLIASEDNKEVLRSLLLPVESLLTAYPAVQLTSTTHFYIQRGQAVLIPHAPTQGYVKLISSDRNFIGIGVILSDGRVAPKRLIKH